VENQKVATGLHDFRITEQEFVLFPSPLKANVGKVKRL
jgi:hypothetical protein